jgi:uncharacterized membrane protein YqjE
MTDIEFTPIVIEEEKENYLLNALAKTIAVTISVSMLVFTILMFIYAPQNEESPNAIFIVSVVIASVCYIPLLIGFIYGICIFIKNCN